MRIASFTLVGLLCLLPVLGLFAGCEPGGGGRKILNVSYDPTRELYREYNVLFKDHWKKTTGESVEVEQSHAGSGAQMRSVIAGQEADVVTLALGFDIDSIADTGIISPEWQKQFPNNNCPYSTTIVFLVRKGNPHGIRDWDDLLKEGIEIITPNPETSGGARWNYLAAWGFALKKELGDLNVLNDPAKKAEVDAAQVKAKRFVADLFKHVRSMDKGARETTNRFVQNKQGDVLLAWENEAFLSKNILPEDGFEIVVPSISIRCEPPVGIVDKIVEKRGTRDLAEGYLRFLYDKEGQKIVAKNYYRPTDPEVLAEYSEFFPKIELFAIDEVFGGWRKVQAEHFDGPEAIFKQILLENAKAK
ncbi:MAG TPA: hypothetical protein DEB39_15600 [Planctomycetaceae bacterium]|nr:hypothetical protein [Planctomycetaceae bacterium]